MLQRLFLELGPGIPQGHDAIEDPRAGRVLHGIETEVAETFELHGQEDRKGSMAVMPTADGGVILVGEAGVQRLTVDAYRNGGG